MNSKKVIKNKNNKKITIIKLLTLSMFIIIGITIYFVTNSLHNNKSEYDYLVFDKENNAYFNKVDENFEVKVVSNKNIVYELTDSAGNKIETKLVNKNKYSIIKPKDKYEKGEVYTLKLIEGKFFDEELKSVNKIEFKIERDEVEHVVYKDNVKKITENIDFINDNTIETVEKYEVGDILIINGRESYKIEQVNKDNTYQVSLPEIDEVYKELDIYIDERIKLNDFIASQDLEEYIAYNVSQTKWYQNIIQTVDAAPLIKVNINTTKAGILEVEVSVTLKAGEEGKAIPALKNHNIKISFKFEIEVSGWVDMKLLYHDVQVTLRLKDTFDISIDYIKAELDNFGEENTDILEEAGKLFSYQQLIEKFDTDESNIVSPIGNAEVPIGNTGLFFNLDLGMLFEYKMSIDFGYKITNEKTIDVGYKWSAVTGKVTTISNMKSKTSNKEAYLGGKASLKMGSELDANLSLLNLASIGLVIDSGAYGESELTFNVINSLDEPSYRIDAKGEAGLFVEATLQIKVLKYTAADWTFYEKKLKLVNYENSIDIKDEPVMDEEDEKIEEPIIDEEITKDPNIILSEEVQKSLEEGFKKYAENDYKIILANDKADYSFKGVRLYWDPCNVNNGKLCYGSETYGTEGMTINEGITLEADKNILVFERKYGLNPGEGKYSFPSYTCTYNFMSKTVTCESFDNIKMLVKRTCEYEYQFFDGSYISDGYGNQFQDVDGCVQYVIGEPQTEEFFKPIMKGTLKYAGLTYKDLK